jgi:hypothetical protein
MIRAARDPSRQSSSNVDNAYDDYVTCDYCQRRFNETAAERHIPHCRQKAQKNDVVKKPGANSNDRLTRRIQYKPPPPKSNGSKLQVKKAEKQDTGVESPRDEQAPKVIFCHCCGCRYQSGMAKFCFECGTRRPIVK